MGVYVDDNRIRRFGRRWSHLTADTTEELHAFAAGLTGPARFHHRSERPWKDHYDVPEETRAEAIRRGAEPISDREAVAKLRAKRRAVAERRAFPPSNFGR